MRKEITKSSLSGIGQFVINTALVLFSIPLFIKTLGSEAYGVFSLVAVVGSVNALANLGLNSSLVRYLAEQGKNAESNYDIVVTFTILFVILLPLTACALLFRQEILTTILNVPLRLLGDAEWLLASMVLGNMLVLLGQTFTAILDSQQKIYVTNLFQVVYNVIYWSSILAAVFLGYGLKGVAIGTLFSGVIWFCMVAISALKSWGPLSLEGIKSNGIRVAKKQLAYGFKIYAGGIIGLFYEPLTKILLSHFIGIGEVGILDIGLRVRNQIVGLVGKLVYPMYPFISKLKDRQRIRDLVHDLEQKMFILVIPLIAIVMLSARPLVELFFRTSVNEISLTVIWIVSAYLIGSMTVLPNYNFLLAKGHAGKTVLIQAMNATVNATVFLLFYRWLGYYAVVISNTLAILSSWVLSLYYQKHFLDSLIFDSPGQAVGLITTFLILVGLGYLTRDAVPTYAAKLICSTFVIAGATAILYRYLDMVRSSDITRYFGDGTLLTRLSMRILCRNAA
jgi:O-antigen/teichoic acid export membrane protein